MAGWLAGWRSVQWSGKSVVSAVVDDLGVGSGDTKTTEVCHKK